MNYTSVVAEYRTPGRAIVIERHPAFDVTKPPWTVKVLTVKKFGNESTALAYVTKHYPQAAWTPGQRTQKRNVGLEILKQKEKDDNDGISI